MNNTGERITLRAGDAEAEISLLGAEPVSWRVGGRELLWRCDSRWWDRTAPILFPVVGASQGGFIQVDGKSYPMPLHGFAKDMEFHLIERGPDFARLRLSSNRESLACFPFAFQLDVTLALSRLALQIGFEVINCDERTMPYAIGFHPGFRWSGKSGRLIFETAEDNQVPCIAPQGLLSRQRRVLPLDGREMVVAADSFAKGALIFRNARSKEVMLVEETGAIRLRADGFGHFAIWSKPDAPFLCLEAWTAHADWQDFIGDIMQRDNMIMLAPGKMRDHGIHLQFLPEIESRQPS